MSRVVSCTHTAEIHAVIDDTRNAAPITKNINIVVHDQLLQNTVYVTQLVYNWIWTECIFGQIVFNDPRRDERRNHSQLAIHYATLTTHLHNTVGANQRIY
jgi:hypothetical protein